MPIPSPHDILDQIQSRLSQSAAATQVIEELLPRSRAEALTWAQRLTGWDEERDRYPGQAVALARVISRQALLTFGLILTPEGRIIDKLAERDRSSLPPEPSLRFRLAIGDEEVCVAYTRRYFPNDDRDNFYFTSPHDPPRPHSLSDSSYWSHFASHDAVEACGSPQAYAALLAEAKRRDEVEAFDAAFDGKPPESQKPRGESKGQRRKKGPPAKSPEAEPKPPAVLGEHTAQVIEERETATQPPQQPPRQRLLFE